MPSIRQSIRSSTASKRPTSAIADGQIALNTASGTPGIFFKDNANNIIKAGPAHYGASAPNSSPAVGGSTGNSIGEAWLDSSLTPAGWKIWNGSAWVNATPLSSDTVQGLVELATNAEVQAGVDTARAVTAAGLQSKVSDSISTTSSSGIASSSAVKTAYDLANAALPKSGGIITGNLEIGSTGSFTFEGATADGFETTLAVVDPTADRTITFPDITGTVITTADTGTVTSTMIANGTIVDADINSSAAIAFSKLASLASANILVGNASGVPTSTTVSGDVTITNAGVTAIASNVIVNADINSSAAIAYSKLALASGIVNTDISASAAVAYSKLALSNSIVNADINSAAAIAGTKISPDFGSQNLTTTGNITATNHIAASGTATTPSIQVGNGTTYKPGVYSPGTDQVAISTNGTGRLFVSASGQVGIGTSPSFPLDVNGTIYTRGRGSTFGVLFDDYRIYNSTSPGALIFDNGSPRLTITSAGLVGIGTSSPGYLVTAATSADGVDGISVESPSSNGVIRLRADGTNGNAIRVGGVGAQGNTLRFLVGGDTERMRIDSSGNVGIGVVPSAQYSTIKALQVGALGATIIAGNTVAGGTSAFGQNFYADPTTAAFKYAASSYPATTYHQYNGEHRWLTAPSGTAGNTITFTQAMTLDSSGRLGVGTTGPGALLHLKHAANKNVYFDAGGTSSCCRITAVNDAVSANVDLQLQADSLLFAANGSERARIDTSGRLLVGTSSARTNFFNSTSSAAGFQAEGLTGEGWIASIRNVNDVLSSPVFLLAKSRGGALNSNTIVQSGDSIGVLSYQGSDGSKFVEAANISAAIDGTPGSGDMPGRLVFSTTADGASSPTERMRISNAGSVLINTTAVLQTSSEKLAVNGLTTLSNSSFYPLIVERKTNDGDLVLFMQDSTTEGSISVSGTTVSYNGAHLSRWSQLPGGTERTEILRGTVLSNVDEMCAWGDEDNEQLNRMKVSDVEGDPNVSGVFQAWDDDDDTYTDDFYCAMTGDFIIRIAEGVTVQRGDLLMSAGDGTAKPQDDDIVRSKTVAKVTSTHVTCTYDDGSYCVPCVLMAC